MTTHILLIVLGLIAAFTGFCIYMEKKTSTPTSAVKPVASVPPAPVKTVKVAVQTVAKAPAKKVAAKTAVRKTK